MAYVKLQYLVNLKILSKTKIGTRKEEKMNKKKLASMYSILIGLSMMVMWVVFYLTDGIPELKIKPVEFGLHLTAELITAILLLIGGYGLLKDKKWGLNVYLYQWGCYFIH